MKNLRVTDDLYSRVIAFINYAESSMATQEELQQFFDVISISLKEQVTSFIFAVSICTNKSLSKSKDLISSIVQLINVETFQPEDYVIS